MRRWAGSIITLLLIVAIGLLGTATGLGPGYGVKVVAGDEIGVITNGGRPTKVIGPGTTISFKPLTGLKIIPQVALPFEAWDEEVVTKDKQRIGVQVAGTITRPSLGDSDFILEKWNRFSVYWVEGGEDLLVGNKDHEGLVQKLAKQAMKSCVGDRNFEAAVVGSGRDELRLCIQEELQELVSPYGLNVQQLVVPNVTISEAVQQLLDQITELKFQTDKAEQAAKKARAEGERLAAEKKAAIEAAYAEQIAREQQKALLAEAERQAIEAQKAVEIQKLENELARVQKEREVRLQETQTQKMLAEREREIAKIRLETARLQAQAELAEMSVQAQIVQENPRYAALQETRARAEALQTGDKLIFLPDGAQVFFGTGSNLMITPQVSQK